MSISNLTKNELSTRLVQAMTTELGTLLLSIARQAALQQLPLYIVGGFVRDLLLGQSGQDLDLVVEGDAIGLARDVASANGGRLTIHPRFKTAQWFPPPAKNIPEYVDLITARSETYKHSAALPTIKPGLLIDDLRRRDFTINTLALRLDGDHFGELRDDLNGLEDLQAGLVRVLHPLSFKDDPTRLFRAVRYEQRYRFKIAPATLVLIPDSLVLIDRLSSERLRHELDLILEEENSVPMLRQLEALHILSMVHPALRWNKVTQTRFINGMSAAHTSVHVPSLRSLGWALWLMDVSSSDLRRIEKRLHFEAGLRDLLLAASSLFKLAHSLGGQKTSHCVSVLDAFPVNAVQAVCLGLSAGPARRKVESYLTNWKHVKPKTTGHDLKRYGLLPGPVYQSILQQLRDAWLDGEVKTTDEEMDLLEKLIRKS